MSRMVYGVSTQEEVILDFNSPRLVYKDGQLCRQIYNLPFHADYSPKSFMRRIKGVHRPRLFTETCLVLSLASTQYGFTKMGLRTATLDNGRKLIHGDLVVQHNVTAPQHIG